MGRVEYNKLVDLVKRILYEKKSTNLEKLAAGELYINLYKIKKDFIK